MFRREHEFESVGQGCQKGSRFPGSVRRMVVQNQPKFGCGRVVGVQLTEKSDELSASVAVDDRTVDMSGHPCRPSR